MTWPGVSLKGASKPFRVASVVHSILCCWPIENTVSPFLTEYSLNICFGVWVSTAPRTAPVFGMSECEPLIARLMALMPSTPLITSTIIVA